MSAVAAALPGGRAWLGFAMATVVLWGVWGTLSGLTASPAFPETLVYCVWALTMVPPALFVLWRNGWRVDRSPRAIVYGLLIGLLGAGGQMLLFKALAGGPAYFIFPIISLSPVITIALSFTLLRERTTRVGAVGVALALLALPLLDLSLGSAEGEGVGWFVLSLLIMLAWGVQAYFMKRANTVVRAESIFFYMTVGALALVPVAWRMTDFGQPIATGLQGPWLVAAIQVLNAVGALCLVYAFRYGKAIVVAPLTNAGGPLITAALSLVLAGVVPGPLKLVGLAMALVASVLLALEPERPTPID
ncbi:DMT family transporter [Luteimonas sp. TWI1437]|uniref:DMT family transporter n=1 Tax=unclassified Luteimonas TaxID=2629088 RepID=UPI00320A0834